jgi:hypothetical protein
MNCWPVNGYNFFGQWETNDWRLTVRDIGYVLIVVIEYLCSQQMVYDNFQGSMMELPGHARSAPENFPTFYKSLQHVVVSRDFVHYACYGDETMKLMLFLANVRTADEMILPTIMQSNATLAKLTRCETTLHYSHWIRPGGSWHPEYLDLEHLPVLMQHAGIDALWARKMNLYTSDVLVWAIDKLREHVLGNEVLSDRLVFFGPSSPTQSPTWAQSDYVPTAAPTTLSAASPSAGGAAAPSSSPGLHRPDDYISEMTWLVPVGLKHIRDIFTNPNTHPRVKMVVQDMPILQKALSGVSVEKLNIHPFAVLKALDAVRRTKDKLHAKEFVNTYFQGRYDSVVPAGQSLEPYLLEEDVDKVSSTSAPDPNATQPSYLDNINFGNLTAAEKMIPARRVVRKGQQAGTNRFKSTEVRVSILSLGRLVVILTLCLCCTV